MFVLRKDALFHYGRKKVLLYKPSSVMVKKRFSSSLLLFANKTRVS